MWLYTATMTVSASVASREPPMSKKTSVRRVRCQRVSTTRFFAAGFEAAFGAFFIRCVYEATVEGKLQASDDELRVNFDFITVAALEWFDIGIRPRTYPPRYAQDRPLSR
jgi:hypothetical protein